MKKLLLLFVVVILCVSSVSAASRVGSSSITIPTMPCTAALPHAEIASVVKAGSYTNTVDFDSYIFKPGDVVCILVDITHDGDGWGSEDAVKHPDDDDYGLRAALTAVIGYQGYTMTLGTWHQVRHSTSSSDAATYGIYRHAYVSTSGGGGGGSVRKIPMILN